MELALEFSAGMDLTGFRKDNLKQSAILHQLLLLGEASKRLSPELRMEFAEIPWKQMAGLRDHIVHAYDSVDVDEIWVTVARDLPDLLPLLRRVQARVAVDPRSAT